MEDNIKSIVDKIEKNLLDDYKNSTGTDLLKIDGPGTFPVRAFRQETLRDLLCEYLETFCFNDMRAFITDFTDRKAKDIELVPELNLKYIDLLKKPQWDTGFLFWWKRNNISKKLRYIFILGGDVLCPITTAEFKELTDDIEQYNKLDYKLHDPYEELGAVTNEDRERFKRERDEIKSVWKRFFSKKQDAFHKEQMISALPDASIYNPDNNNNNSEDIDNMISNEEKRPEGPTVEEAIKQEENKIDNCNCARSKYDADSYLKVFSLRGYPSRDYPELNDSENLIERFKDPDYLDSNNETEKLNRLDILIYRHGISSNKPNIHLAEISDKYGFTFHWTILSDDEVKWLEDKDKEINDFIEYRKEHNPECASEDATKFDNFRTLLYNKFGIKNLKRVISEKIYDSNKESSITLPEVPTDQQENLKAFRATIEEMYSLYKKKNSDYTANNKMGSAFEFTYNLFGLTAPGVRLADKFIRYVALTTGKEQQVKNESVEDTLIDMANYAVMTLMEIRKGKNK